MKLDLRCKMPSQPVISQHLVCCLYYLLYFNTNLVQLRCRLSKGFSTPINIMIYYIISIEYECVYMCLCLCDASKNMIKITEPFMLAPPTWSLKICHITTACSANNSRHYRVLWSFYQQPIDTGSYFIICGLWGLFSWTMAIFDVY